MFAKFVGAIAAIVIFFVYFAIIGTSPVFETLVGVVLSLGGGAAAWWEIDRWLRRRREADE